MDRIHAMTTFVSLVDSGGFSAAARRLGTSTSGVSRTIAMLEARLNVSLVARTNRKFQLTDAGRAFYEDAHRILAELERIELLAAGTHAAPRGALTVTAPQLFGKMYVAPVVTEYLTRYPEVHVHCWLVDRVVSLLNEGVDVAIRVGELPDSSEQAIGVGKLRRVVCATPAYFAQHGVPQKPEDLAHHVTIHAAGLFGPPQWRFMTGTTQVGVHLEPRLTTTTTDSVIDAVKSGFGIASLYSYQIEKALQTGELEIALADYEPRPLPVHVVHREGRYAAQKVRNFIDLVVERLRSMDALNDAA
jgi:DNA-binding transcriptional LysR family regulator